MARRVRALGIVAGTVAVVALGAGIWGRQTLAGSLPLLDGSHVLAGLSAPVSVDRDSLGVPTIRGASRLDVARATGFVHAQERFFQMDLARRRAAGELAALVGPGALATDKSARVFRFRARAQQVMAEARADERALIEAYTSGVNAGLSALGSRPFEYLVLRSAPKPWQPDDTVLVVASMFFALQESTAGRESRVALTRDTLPPALADFLLAPAREWEAPLSGDPSPSVAMPGPEVVDLRASASIPQPQAGAAGGTAHADSAFLLAAGWTAPPGGDWSEELRGSNNWVVSGAHTANGAALVADDMHLQIGVPNIWYRASYEWDAADGHHRVTGVTLPGTPTVIAGSNGAVAWGFTNTHGDFSDLILVEPDPASADRYLTPTGPQAFERHPERIAVKGAADEALDVRETIWGPVVDTDHAGRVRAVSWVPARPGGLNLHLFGIETAASIEAILPLAHEAGMPAQNLVVGERGGRIAWTVAGRIPRRVGFDGRVPASWADGTRRWDGWLDTSEYPRIVDPASGRIWTANNRLVDGDMLRAIGDGSFDPGARARQIRDRLLSVERATPADMLAIQLDDRALFLACWRDLVLGVLTPQATAGSASRAEFRRLVDQTWTGRASADSVAYRLVRTFRLTAADLALKALLAPALRADTRPGATASGWVSTIEGPLWRLVSEQPAHLLDPKFRTWSDLLITAVDRSVESLTEGGRALAERSWGEANTAAIAHPLSSAIPQAWRWLDMPREPLSGDSHMPRVQRPSGGASERLAVSPGFEQEGYFHMPGGQSGHPLSPHYGDGHAAWVKGDPTPFMPGAAVNRLSLTPR